MTKPNKFEIEKGAGFEGFLFFFFADGLPPIKKKGQKAPKDAPLKRIDLILLSPWVAFLFIFCFPLLPGKVKAAQKGGMGLL